MTKQGDKRVYQLMNSDFFNTPFPRPEANKSNVLWVIMIGLGCSVFILLYKPFGIIENNNSIYLNAAVFSLGLLFSGSIIFLEWIGPRIFSRFFKNWTVGKAIIWYSLVIFFVTINIFLYKNYLSDFKEISWIGFVYVLYRILIISFTVSFFIFGFWNYFNKQRITKLTSQSQYTIIPQSGKPFKIKQDKSRQMIISSTKDESIEIPVSVKYESFIRSNL